MNCFLAIRISNYEICINKNKMCGEKLEKNTEVQKRK